jgi:hypothetical protein
MTKAFLHGRTEAIRTVQPESVEFVKAYCNTETAPHAKVAALRKACKAHVDISRECSKGQGQDRILYAMYCLATQNGGSLPDFFNDQGYAKLNHTTLSTSNCGNPSLRFFGFGPVVPDGFGIGYIIKDDALSFCASSKHLQTQRFLDTLNAYLTDVQRLIVKLHREANERPNVTFVDHHAGIVDAKTGQPVTRHVRGQSVSSSRGTTEWQDMMGGCAWCPEPLSALLTASANRWLLRLGRGGQSPGPASSDQAAAGRDAPAPQVLRVVTILVCCHTAFPKRIMLHCTISGARRGATRGARGSRASWMDRRSSRVR